LRFVTPFIQKIGSSVKFRFLAPGKGQRLKEKGIKIDLRPSTQGPLAWKLECLEARRPKTHGVRRRAKGVVQKVWCKRFGAKGMGQRA
jgi:hypothetical protein